MVMSSFIHYEKRGLLGMSKKKASILIEISGMALNRNNLENYKWEKDLTLTYNWGNENHSFWKDVKAGTSSR